MSTYPDELYHSSVDISPDETTAKPLTPDETRENAPRRMVFEFMWGLVGSIIGFLVRVISLKASSLVSSSKDAASYLILSQADLGLHVLFWLTFFAMILARKSSYRRHFLISSIISLMMGVLVGSFLAWNFIDLKLGFPLSWTSRLLSYNLMLIQCCLLFCCHDIVSDQESQETNDLEKEGPSILAIV